MKTGKIHKRFTKYRIIIVPIPIPCGILLPVLVSIAILNCCSFLVNTSYAETQSGNASQTIAETKPSDPASEDKTTSDTPIDKPGESRKPPPPATPKPAVKEPVLSESEQWQKQVEELMDQIKKGEKP